MAKHKIAMDDYDDSKQGNVYGGEEPRRGVYEGKLVRVEDHTSANSGNEGLKWTFEISKGEFLGWRGYTYSDFDNSMWKTQGICHAITQSKKSITINTDDEGASLAAKAKKVNLRVVNEQYEGERRAKIRSVLLLAEADDEEEDDADDPFA